MLNFITCEFFKLKRSKLFLIILLASIFPPCALFAGVILGNASPVSMEYFLDNVLLYYLLLFNVMIFALLMSHLIVKEYDNHTLKSILTTPISRNKFIFGKLIVFLIIMILLSILAFVSSIVLGYACGGEVTWNVLSDYFIKFLEGNILIAFTLTPFMFISLIFKNNVPTIVVSVIASLLNSMVYSNEYGAIIPFCIPTLVVKNELVQYSYGTTLPILIIFITFIIGLILSLIYFNKTDVNL